MEELIAFNPMYESFLKQVDGKPGDAGFSANWFEAVGFCRWLGQQAGFSEEDQAYAAPDSLDEKNYPRESAPSESWAPRDWPVDLGRRGFRLPTEAEWEIASRAGARTAYGYGSDVTLLSRFGWFLENSDRHMQPPRGLRPGTRGLYDLHGNQFEWTHDWHGAYGGGATTDPLGIKKGSSRVTRGGSWDNGAAFCRSAFRSTDDPTLRSNDFGFRLALNSPFAQSPNVVTVNGSRETNRGAESASAE